MVEGDREETRQGGFGVRPRLEPAVAGRASGSNPWFIYSTLLQKSQSLSVDSILRQKFVR